MNRTNRFYRMIFKLFYELFLLLYYYYINLIIICILGDDPVLTAYFDETNLFALVSTKRLVIYFSGIFLGASIALAC